MTDFALYHCGSWKAGELEKLKVVIAVVSHDQTYNAYTVYRNEMEQFISFIADVYAGDRYEQGEGEPDMDFLDRIGISISIKD